MEARIMGTIGSSIDERSTTLNQNLTEAFAAENAAMRLAVDGMTTVMQAIGGDQFEAMATKMSKLDESNDTRVALLTTMFGSSCNELRDRMVGHEHSFQELYAKLTCRRALCSGCQVRSS